MGALARFGEFLLRSGLSVTPRQQLFQARDLVIGDTGEDVGEPGLRVDAVELGGLDQAVEDGGDLVRRLGLDRVVAKELAEVRPEELGATRDVDDLPLNPAHLPLDGTEAGGVEDQRFPDQIQEVHGSMLPVGGEHVSFPEAVLNTRSVN